MISKTIPSDLAAWWFMNFPNRNPRLKYNLLGINCYLGMWRWDAHELRVVSLNDDGTFEWL